MSPSRRRPTQDIARARTFVPVCSSSRSCLQYLSQSPSRGSTGRSLITIPDGGPPTEILRSRLYVEVSITDTSFARVQATYSLPPPAANAIVDGPAPTSMFATNRFVLASSTHTLPA